MLLVSFNNLSTAPPRWCCSIWWGVEEGGRKIWFLKWPGTGLWPGSTGRWAAASAYCTSQLNVSTRPSAWFPETPPAAHSSALRLVRGKKECFVQPNLMTWMGVSGSNFASNWWFLNFLNLITYLLLLGIYRYIPAHNAINTKMFLSIHIGGNDLFPFTIKCQF